MNEAATLDTLSIELNRSVAPRFFLPLSGPWRNLAVDLLNHLAPAFSRGRRSLPRTDVLALIEEVVLGHPAVSLPSAGDASDKEWDSPTYRANYYFGQLVSAGWIVEDEFRHNLRRMTVSLDSNAHALIALLRDLASSNLSTSARFSDTFRSVLDTILDPHRHVFGTHDERPYATLKDLIDRCAKGMLVLRRIENVLRRFTREQAETLSRRRNLELVVEELQKLTRTQYYQELQNPLLFSRCAEAVVRLDEVAFTADSVHRLKAECLLRAEAEDDATAEVRVRRLLDELTHLLTGLRGEAAQIETWAARFLKASLAKFRHLQTIPSRQVELARSQLDRVTAALGGRKWWQDLSVDLLPPPRLPDFGFLWGRSSLHQPHVTRPILSPPRLRRSTPVLDEEVIQQLAATRRKALTPERASRFVSRVIPNVGGSIESLALLLPDADALLDVVACFCYANSPKVNFRIERNRAAGARYVAAGAWLLERFTLHRTR